MADEEKAGTQKCFCFEEPKLTGSGTSTVVNSAGSA